MPKYCSPRKKIKNKSLQNISCFNETALRNIARAYNTTHPSFTIDIPTKLINSNLLSFWNTLRKQISKHTDCSEENCWIETTIGKKALSIDKNIESFLRPLKPKEWDNNPTEWLSTIDIEQVLNQYNVYNDFIFIGAVPIDFDVKLGPGMCVINELCNINISKLYKRGIHKIGIVFNLDKHTEEGSHWISLFVSINKASIFYFDSYGYPPNKEISTLIHKIRKMMNSLFISKPQLLKYIDMDNNIVTRVHRIKEKNYSIPAIFQKDTPVFYMKRKLYKPIKITHSKQKGDVYHIQTSVDIPTNTNIFQKGTFVFYNSKRYQFKTSACGMYSIIFIIELLKNKSIYRVLREMKSDDDIEALRDKYFRPNIFNK